jgi:hypothetical protein
LCVPLLLPLLLLFQSRLRRRLGGQRQMRPWQQRRRLRQQ